MRYPSTSSFPSKGAAANIWTGSPNQSRFESDRLQRLVKVFDDVVDIFNADRNADHSVSQADRFSSLIAKCRMGHGGGMRDQRFHAAERFTQRADTNLAQHFLRVLE